MCPLQYHSRCSQNNLEIFNVWNRIVPEYKDDMPSICFRAFIQPFFKTRTSILKYDSKRFTKHQSIHTLVKQICELTRISFRFTLKNHPGAAVSETSSKITNFLSKFSVNLYIKSFRSNKKLWNVIRVAYTTQHSDLGAQAYATCSTIEYYELHN